MAGPELAKRRTPAESRGVMARTGATTAVQVATGRFAESAIVRLSARLIRRGALLLALAAAAYVTLEIFSYRATYPDAASRAQIATFQDNPAVRMLQGVPHAADTPGGFVVWDDGWVIQAVLGVWVLLATGRLLRGEEEAERAELMLAAPVRATRATSLQLVVLSAALGLVGAAVTVAMALSGAGVLGSVLFGAGLAGAAGTFAGVSAISAQVFPLRRRAVGAAAAAFGLSFLVRMIANSADSRGWLRWLTPFGWMDELRPFGDNRWPVLVPLLVAPVALYAVAVGLRARRDTGGGLLAEPDRRRARLRLLGSPEAFAWRSTEGMLLGWLAGVVAYALIIGSVVKSAVDFVARDPNYRRVLEALGMDDVATMRGFIGVLGALLGVLFAMYACWRIGAVRTEEASARLEHILTRPVSRTRWLAGHALLTALSSALLAVGSGLAMWAGVAASGAGVTVFDAVVPALNTLPVVVLFGGLAVLVFGVLPRLTVAVSVVAVVLAYLIEVLGPALKWPDWIMNVSPFHHLAYVPSEPFAPTAAAVLTVLGILAALLGIAVFQRRDLAGA